MIQKEKTVCFTGHRDIIISEVKPIKEIIEKKITEGFDTFLSGGARGFDHYAGLMVLKLKEKYPHIRLILILPCNKDIMSNKWDNKDKAILSEIILKSENVIYISDEYYNGCMKDRNAKLVELSSFCIAYYKKYKSGTGQTVRMMERAKGEVFNIV